MKRAIFFLVFWVLCGIITQAQSKVFTTLSQTEEAFMLLGEKIFYTPHDTSGFKPLGKNEKVVRTTKDKIILADVIGGKNFVVIPKGTELVIDSRDNSVIRIWKCGNKIYGIWDVPLPKKETTLPKDIQLSNSKIEIVVSGKVDVYHHYDQSRETARETQQRTIPVLSETKKESTLFRDILGGIAAGIASGFIFQDEETIETPGIKLQTGDGTFRFGPSKIETSKKFSWKNAGLGFLGGFLTLRIALN